MRVLLLLFVLMAVLFGSGYWYRSFEGVCTVPIRYRIGTIDDRFGTSAEELKRIARSAEAVWEDAVGADLFMYDESAALPINMVFDERQENADRERELREDIEAKEGMSESVSAQYETLIKEFRALKREYEKAVIAYEAKLGEYNDTVTDWNEKGGAPVAVIEKLEETKRALESEQLTLKERAAVLNRLAGKLNALGASGNSLITDYNSIVEKYNEEFSEGHEFTQGDYTGDAINIYQFDAEDDLTIVLAHEFGHALALDHVPNEQSIMYHKMGAQDLEKGVSVEDIAEYARVCASGGVPATITRFVVRVIGGFTL